uniref:Uncharacterized protein n=1 Tax=Timema shepardi TaxID=629360 RepID=A0A7R9FYX8_TIMSH|nr:unnamed protein product [Timema shepardi]
MAGIEHGILSPVSRHTTTVSDFITYTSRVPTNGSRQGDSYRPHEVLPSRVCACSLTLGVEGTHLFPHYPQSSSYRGFGGLDIQNARRRVARRRIWEREGGKNTTIVCSKRPSLHGDHFTTAMRPSVHSEEQNYEGYVIYTSDVKSSQGNDDVIGNSIHHHHHHPHYLVEPEARKKGRGMDDLDLIERANDDLTFNTREQIASSYHHQACVHLSPSLSPCLDRKLPNGDVTTLARSASQSSAGTVDKAAGRRDKVHFCSEVHKVVPVLPAAVTLLKALARSRYSSPVTSLVLSDSSQLTSDSPHLVLELDCKQWLALGVLLLVAAALGVGVGVPLALELRSSRLLEARLQVVRRILREVPLIDG